MAAETAAAKWKRWISTLRAAHPCEYPVKVIRTKLLPDVWGDCLLIDGKGGPYFRIRVDSTVPLGVAFTFILLHEWAHAMTWDSTLPHDHCDAWGITYAELWREHMGDGDYEDDS